MCFFFGFKVQIILRGQNNNWYIKGCRYNQGGKMVAQFCSLPPGAFDVLNTMSVSFVNFISVIAPSLNFSHQGIQRSN